MNRCPCLVYRALCMALLGAVAASAAPAPETYAVLGLPRNAAEKAAACRPAFSIADPVGPRFSEAEKNFQRNAGRELLQRLRTAKKTLFIAPGDYRFDCSQPILIEGLRDVSIEARGVTFWLDRPADRATADCWGFQFLKCRGVTLRGLTIDYDPPLYIQGRIEAIDYARRTLDMTVDDGFPVTAFRPLQVIFFRANGEYIPQPPMFHDGIQVLGGNELRVAVKSMDQLRAQSEDPKILEAFDGRGKIGAGDYAVLPFRTGTALQLEQCARMKLEDVTLYAAPGFAFLESGGEGGHVYRRCKVIRRPGTRRLWAGNADAFHSRALEKGSRLEGCEFSFIGDDFLNFHSFWHLATHRYAANRFVIFPHMYERFRAGQRIEFFDPVSAASQGEAVVTSIEALEDPAILEKTRQTPEKHGYIPYHGKPIIVTLDREVSAADGSLVDSRSLDSPRIVVKDCFFHDGMGRGALVEGVRDITFKNNTWRDCNGGVQAFSCMWFYVEGPHPKGVTVRGNRFINADAIPAVVQQYQPVNGTICMTLVANGGNYPRTVVNGRDFVVEDNVLYRPRNFPILAAYTRGVTVKGNRIIEPWHYVSRIGYDTTPAYYVAADGVANPACAVFVVQSEGVRVGGNEVVDPEGLLSSVVCFGKGVEEARR